MVYGLKRYYGSGKTSAYPRTKRVAAAGFVSAGRRYGGYRRRQRPASNSLRLSRFLSNAMEMKYIEAGALTIADIENPTSGTNGNVRYVPIAVAQGDSQYARQGNKIFLQYISMNGVLERTGSSQLNTRVRFMLVQDTSTQQTTGALPVYSDVLSAATGNDDLFVTAPYNVTQVLNTKRFKILLDKTLDVGVYTTSTFPYAGMPAIKHFKWRVPCKSVVTYNADDASNSYGKNWVYLFVFSDSADSDTDNVRCTYNVRAAFYDN